LEKNKQEIMFLIKIFLTKIQMSAILKINIMFKIVYCTPSCKNTITISLNCR
jgi:hypothetical protein